MKNGSVLIPLLLSCLFNFLPAGMKEHEIWWEKNLDLDIPYSMFAEWLGDEDSPSRRAMRRHVAVCDYQSILDAAAGLGVDYLGFKKEGVNIEYQGLDITPKLVLLAQEKEIPIMLGNIEKLPFPDSFFDICYARHILEHLDYYKTAINQMIRVAREEVLIIFFIPPKEGEEDLISLGLVKDNLLYHNAYSKEKLEKFILSDPKVDHINWEFVENKVVVETEVVVDDQVVIESKVIEKHEMILHIYLNPIVYFYE